MNIKTHSLRSFRFMNKFFLFSFAIILFASSIIISGQTKPLPKVVSAGVVNGKATTLVKPEYPAAAAAIQAIGEVRVAVTIDEQGNVISAEAISGHTLLREAAEKAALQSKFAPTTLSGQPVKVTGTIIYKFVTPTKSYEEKVIPMGMGMGLYILRQSANDLKKLNKIFETPDFVKEVVMEMPEFSKETAPLNSLNDKTVEKRREIIDGVIVSVRSKLSVDEVWQFDVGKNLGELISQMIVAFDGENLDSAKLNEADLRSNLIKIDELMLSAPKDFPSDVLEKFKEFSALKDRESLTEPENLQEVLDKTMQIFETISPDITT